VWEAESNNLNRAVYCVTHRLRFPSKKIIFPLHSTAKRAGRMEVSGAVHSDWGLLMERQIASAEDLRYHLPVTRTRPRTTIGEREILGDEIA